jgi:hypothetical protein
LAKTWIDLGRARRRRRRKSGDGVDRWDHRYSWIAENAGGRSFADIGGLFAIEGDVALAAEKAGAEPVTLFDGGDPGLTHFPAKAQERDSKIRVVQGDLEDPEAVRRVGVHDVVWCTGVIYHTPNPLLQLMHLREITREFLYLGTHTVPEVPGMPQACLFYPHLDDATRTAVLRAHGGAGAAPGLGVPFDESPMMGQGNFWWGITPSALRAMLRTARFEVVEEVPLTEAPFLTDVIARPIDRPPLMPPPSYYRERAEARERGEPAPAFEEFYDESGRGYI